MRRWIKQTKWIRTCVAALAIAGSPLLEMRRAAALTPEQIAVVFNVNNSDSQMIAAAYQQARHIPRNNLIGLNIIGHEEITTPLVYQTSVENIRATLKQRHLEDQITCLLTVDGVPLRIASETPTVVEQKRDAELRQQMVDAGKDLQNAIASFDAIAPIGIALPGAGAGGVTVAVPPPQVLPPGQLVPAALSAANRAIGRINEVDSVARGEALKTFLPLMRHVLGLQGIRTFHSDGPETPEEATLRSQADAKIAADQAAYQQIVEQNRQHEAAAELVKLQTEMNGAIGTVAELERVLQRGPFDDTQSCFDNELMLLWSDHYSKPSWLMNPYSLEACAGRGGLPKDHPKTMMVARLDGLTRQAVLLQLKMTLETEASGLNGTAYFDARGLHGTDEYSQFDENLRQAAAWMRENSTMKVVLDDRPELLQAKDCPDAALYCGWYSYFHYIDSCQWLPGSVGYHVASFEMGTLKDPKTPAWVPNLLKRGVVATLGPTTEPSLRAFPKPREFFPLLASGQWSLAEVYFMTTPNTSWQIGLIGDPLYRPYGKHPAVTPAAIQADALLRWAYTIEPVGGK
jgi:uncharacterized protein (TIGR03790 family)